MATNPYASYVDGRDPLEVTRATPSRLENLLHVRAPETLTVAPAPGKWSVRDIAMTVPIEGARGARTHACRVETRLDTHLPGTNDSVGISADAARMSARATSKLERKWSVRDTLSHFDPERGDMTLQVVVEIIPGHALLA
jgi:hypothetical protein